MHHAPHERPTDEDLGPLSQHRMLVPGAIWAAALVFACVASLFDAQPAPGATTAQPAPVAAPSAAGRG